MAQPIWLLPLNSSHNHTIHVSAHQYAPPPSSTPPATDEDAEPTLSIKVNVTVDFSSSYHIVQRTVKGLSVSKSFNLPSDTIDIDDVSNVIAQIKVPFSLDEIQWESRMIGRDRSTAFLEDEDDLVDKLTKFLLDLVSASCNANRRRLGVLLVVKKSVTLPADLFEAWTEWYDEQAATRESFEREYGEAIARPREERELLEERVFGFRQLPDASSSLEAVRYDGGGHDGAAEKEQCSICLEELEVGARVTRLPCAHQFHGGCVFKWLTRRSNASCPLCRYALTEDHFHSLFVSLSICGLNPLSELEEFIVN